MLIILLQSELPETWSFCADEWEEPIVGIGIVGGGGGGGGGGGSQGHGYRGVSEGGSKSHLGVLTTTGRGFLLTLSRHRLRVWHMEKRSGVEKKPLAEMEKNSRGQWTALKVIDKR